MPSSKSGCPRRVSTHKTFQRNERAIHKAINTYILKRSIGVCVRDVCRDAGVSFPTFYVHSASINEAYRDYEQSLVEDFVVYSSEYSMRNLIFTMLLSFIHRHRDYFRAALWNTDLYILGKILDRERYLLVGAKISDQAFLIYRNEIASIVMVWANFDHFRKSKLDFYLQKILKVRIREW